MRLYYWLQFYVFFGVIKPIRKSGQWSILPFLSSFIKMKEQKKSGGFMHNIFHAAVHRVIFKLGTHFTSMSNGWVIHCLWVKIIPLSLFSVDWLLFRSSKAFGVCFVKSMLPGHTIWRANKFEDCLPWVHQLSSPLSHFPCASPTLITTSSTYVSCWLMKDTSMPSFSRFHPVDFNTLSGIEI